MLRQIERLKLGLETPETERFRVPRPRPLRVPAEPEPQPGSVPQGPEKQPDKAPAQQPAPAR